ncbi:MAG: IS110 family transposase [Porphyromonadaceae bacterium]|nr:MAG: IS110 family transposase [Porphyromonadaceae bacterium]
MNTNLRHFIGIDVSKNTLDFALIKDGDSSCPITGELTNNSAGMVKLEEFLKKQDLHLDETLFCMEQTGIYSRLLSQYLIEQMALVWLEMPVQIIRSLGIQRGKNDHIDAVRIAEYACLKKDQAILWQPPREVVLRINDLLTLRDRLITSRKSLKQPIKEFLEAGFTDTAKLIESKCSSTLKALDKETAQIESDLDKLIKKDSNLNRLYMLATSVAGIGQITALTLLYFTNEFQIYTNPRQLSCYSGVAPFEHTSGTSVRGRPRVSNFANKRLKKLLHMAALSTIAYDPELAGYFQRKVGEGKNKMLVINAIRNKIIHRLCAVIKRGTPYQLNYQPT